MFGICTLCEFIVRQISNNSLSLFYKKLLLILLSWLNFDILNTYENTMAHICVKMSMIRDQQTL